MKKGKRDFNQYWDIFQYCINFRDARRVLNKVGELLLRIYL